MVCLLHQTILTVQILKILKFVEWFIAASIQIKLNKKHKTLKLQTSIFILLCFDDISLSFDKLILKECGILEYINNKNV